MREQLYVALTADGAYLKQHVVETHGGTKVRFESVSLNQADALPKHFWCRLKAPTRILVPVTVSRIVTIVTEELIDDSN